jgi:hypothetical protein
MPSTPRRKAPRQAERPRRPREIEALAIQRLRRRRPTATGIERVRHRDPREERISALLGGVANPGADLMLPRACP